MARSCEVARDVFARDGTDRKRDSQSLYNGECWEDARANRVCHRS